MNRPPHKDLLRTLVLLMLDEAPRHGYEIMLRLGEMYGSWRPAPSTVYPLLDELKKNGMIEEHILEKNVRSGGRLKYRITEKGRKELARLLEMVAPSLSGVMVYMVSRGREFCEKIGSKECVEAVDEAAARLGYVAAAQQARQGQHA